MKLIFLALILIPSAALAQFTVDDRSLLHLGASAVIAGSVNAVGIATQTPAWRRWSAAGLSCMVVGMAKEMHDTYVDYGDLAFDALGCAVGIGLTDVTLAPLKNGAAIGWRW